MTQTTNRPRKSVPPAAPRQNPALAAISALIVVAVFVALGFMLANRQPGIASEAPVATPLPFATVDPAAQPGAATTDTSSRVDMYSAAPALSIDTSKLYKATIETSKGNIVLELYPEYAPQTVNNFVFLARNGFYDGLKFHRVIEGFMIQGGDPAGNGTGGPGYQFADEVEGNPLVHDRGVISMANSGPNTNGSQFFITREPQPHLNGLHTVFGKVLEGQEAVDAMQQDDVMTKVTITEE